MAHCNKFKPRVYCNLLEDIPHMASSIDFHQALESKDIDGLSILLIPEEQVWCPDIGMAGITCTPELVKTNIIPIPLQSGISPGLPHVETDTVFLQTHWQIFKTRIFTPCQEHEMPQRTFLIHGKSCLSKSLVTRATLSLCGHIRPIPI